MEANLVHPYGSQASDRYATSGRATKGQRGSTDPELFWGKKIKCGIFWWKQKINIY